MEPGPDQPGLQQSGWRRPLGRQLQAQGSKSLPLSPLDGHGADLQPLSRSPERQALQDCEPERDHLGGGQLIHQLLQSQLLLNPACRQLGLRGGQLIEQAGLAINAGIEAEVTQRAAALLMQAVGDAHQPHPIAQVMLQGPADAAAQIGRWRLTGSAAGSGADQGLTGYLDQIFPLHQREQAPGGS